MNSFVYFVRDSSFGFYYTTIPKDSKIIHTILDKTNSNLKYDYLYQIIKEYFNKV